MESNTVPDLNLKHFDYAGGIVSRLLRQIQGRKIDRSMQKDAILSSPDQYPAWDRTGGRKIFMARKGDGGLPLHPVRPVMLFSRRCP